MTEPKTNANYPRSKHSKPMENKRSCAQNVQRIFRNTMMSSEFKLRQHKRTCSPKKSEYFKGYFRGSLSSLFYLDFTYLEHSDLDVNNKIDRFLKDLDGRFSVSRS